MQQVLLQKEHPLRTSGVEPEGQLPALGSKPFGEGCKSLILRLCRRNEILKKNYQKKRKERACASGSERFFHLAVTCREGEKKKVNNFLQHPLKSFRPDCVVLSRAPSDTVGLQTLLLAPALPAAPWDLPCPPSWALSHPFWRGFVFYLQSRCPEAGRLCGCRGRF